MRMREINIYKRFWNINQVRYYVNVKYMQLECDYNLDRLWMWDFDHKEGQAQKNWCFWTVVLEKTLKGPLDSKEIQPVSPTGNQPWIFIERTDAVAETPTLWPPDGKSWVIGKDPDAGKDWEQEKGSTEDEMAGWHHWLDGLDREAWRAAVHGFTKSQTRLSDWTEPNYS